MLQGVTKLVIEKACPTFPATIMCCNLGNKKQSVYDKLSPSKNVVPLAAKWSSTFCNMFVTTLSDFTPFMNALNC